MQIPELSMQSCASNRPLRQCQRRPKFKAGGHCSYTCQAISFSWDIWSILELSLGVKKNCLDRLSAQYAFGIREWHGIISGSSGCVLM